MVHTTTGADNIIPLGNHLNLLTSTSYSNSTLEIRVPPDKCTILNLSVTHGGKVLRLVLVNREPPDKGPSDDYFRDLGINEVILSNYGALPNDFDFMKILSFLFTSMT